MTVEGMTIINTKTWASMVSIYCIEIKKKNRLLYVPRDKRVRIIRPADDPCSTSITKHIVKSYFIPSSKFSVGKEFASRVWSCDLGIFLLHTPRTSYVLFWSFCFGMLLVTRACRNSPVSSAAFLRSSRSLLACQTIYKNNSNPTTSPCLLYTSPSPRD